MEKPKENSVGENEKKKRDVREIPDKIDMDNGNFPYAKDIGLVLAKTILSGSHRAIIDCILDKTIGWYDPKSEKVQKLKKRKIKEQITYKDFENYTGIIRNHISKYIKELIDWKVIKRWEKGQYCIYGLNVYVNQWNKGIFRRSVTRVGDTLKCHKDRGQSVTRIGDTLSQGLVTLTGPKANNNKPFPTPKETIKETYIKKEEKDHTFNDKSPREEEEIFNYWNTHKINPGSTIKPYIQDIKEALNDYSPEEIKLAIGNYAYIVNSEDYILNYQYSLDTFLKGKNIEKFLDLERAKGNYKNNTLRQDSGGDCTPDYYHDPIKDQDKRTIEEIRIERERISNLAGVEARKMKELLR